MTFLPVHLLANPDQKTAAEHTRVAEELFGAAATTLQGGSSRKRLTQASVLAQLGHGHALLAAVKSQRQSDEI